jgi:hypothetical protein
MKRIITICTLFFLGGITLSAQNFESYKRQQQKAFGAYKQRTQEEWEAYRRKVNAEFAEFLGRPWEQKQVEKPKTEPRKEPDVPPVVLPEIDVTIPEDRPIDVNVNFPKLEEEPKPVAPVPYRPKPAEQVLSFTFYGTTGSVRFDHREKVSLSGSDEKAVSRFWKALSGEAYDNIVADCQRIRQERELCDWAYYKMTEKLAEVLYPAHNERAVFHAWLLSQSGFSIRLGRENGNIRLLLGTSALIFRKPYWKLKDGNFTLMDGGKVESMSIMDVPFPQTTPLRLRMKAANRLTPSPSPVRELASKRYPNASASVSCDKNLLAFLEDYPSFSLNGSGNADYLNYADMALSEGAGAPLLNGLRTQMAGKSEADAANILLNFVQTAFEYKTDPEVWGRERPFFPEETLYYPYCDCEDRAILFCRLVRDLMGLETAFVSYPGHLAAAVHFKENIPGDYFLIESKRYLVCDPTYINASIGRTMPGMSNATAEVFVWE